MLLQNSHTSCSSCGISIELQDSTTDVYVCLNCHHKFKKEHATLHSYTAAYAVPEDMTPLRVGTKGRVDDTDFEIIGRHRIMYNNGYMNFWQVMTLAGKLHYIGESPGFYYWLTHSLETPGLTKVKNMEAGKVASWTGVKQIFTDQILQYKSDWIEGEILHLMKPATDSFFIELSNIDGSASVLCIQNKEKIIHLQGRLVPFESFNFKQVRQQ